MRGKAKMSAEQRGIERCVAMVYTLLYIALFFGFIIKQWSPMYLILDMLAIGGGIGLYFFKPFDYKVRAFITVFLAHFVVAHVYVHTSLTSIALVFLIATTVTAGLYGIDKIIVIPIVLETICFAHHGAGVFVNKMIDIESFWDFFFPVISVYVIDYVLYMWLKQRNIAQRNLVKTLHKLEYTQRSKRDFLVKMSQEIKNPINASREVCEGLRHEQDVDYLHNNIQFIQAAESWMVGNVEDLTDYSLMQQETISIEKQDYETRDFIQRLVSISMAMKGSKNIDVIFDVDATLPRVLKGDERRVLRIVNNVMNNAIKYTKNGGVSCSITKSSDESGTCLLITVADTGCGMSPEFLIRMQEAFVQFDDDFFTNYQGIGLGLLMTHTLLEWMRGTISFNSEVGKGTVVTIILPQEVVDETHIRDSYGKKTICFLEDNGQRDERILSYYRNEFEHMSEQLSTEFVFCTTMVEFQNQLHMQDYENILISVEEYEEYATYFERLAEWHNVVMTTAFYTKKPLENKKIRRVLEPFWFDSLIANIEDENHENAEQELVAGTYILPDVSVLIVDDNQMNLQILSRLLSRYQMKIVTADNGRKAIEYVENQDFDLIFMDYMMPDMNGVDTMRAIRRLDKEGADSVPMIALTSDIVPGIRDEFMELGFNDLALKPLDSSVLERIMHSCIPREKWISCNENKKPKDKEARNDRVEDDIKGLDMELGITYCGGEESYELILRDYAQKGNKNWENLQKLFDGQQWEEYTIEVHGVKSSLLSIGAREVSEKAKRLEHAGKDKDITYILEHHQELVDAYTVLIETLKAYYHIEESEKNGESASAIAERGQLSEAISQEMLHASLDEMEDSAYLLEKDKMIQIVENIRQYSYQGESVEEACQECLRKIEKEDYISAWAGLEHFFSGLQ